MIALAQNLATLDIAETIGYQQSSSEVVDEMARKQQNDNIAMRINKSAKIRQLLEERGMDSSPSEIAKELTAQGISVTPANVSQVKLQMKKRKGSGRGRRKSQAVAPATFEPATTSRPTNGGIGLEDIQTVKALLGRLGPDTLAQLVGLLG